MARRVILGFAFTLAVLVAARAQQAQQRSSGSLPAAPLNARPGVAYLGSRACKSCHLEIWQSFSRTDMGRSISLASARAEADRLKEPVSVYDPAIGRYFRVFVSGGDVYQSEYSLDSSGHVAAEQRERIAYTVGAGENGYSYLIERGSYLFQAPLSFYSKTGKWDLSPAHEMGFSRPIEESCIACHAGLPQPVAHREALYRNPPFRELAIGCEKCHGPGELHVKARLAGERAPQQGDPTIANPGRMPRWLGNNTCMFCHEKGDAEVLQPGKSYLDYRPGTPLDDTLAIFQVSPKPGGSDQSPLLNHYFLMTASKCYRSSKRQLSCLTCHDPHLQPSAAEAPAYYRKKCLACHTTGSCNLPLAMRLDTAPPDNCIGCHMPARSLTGISHSALTDHRIPARPGEPFPAFRKDDLVTPGLIHLTAIPGRDDSLSPLTRLRAYAQVAAGNPTYEAQYERLLAEITPTESEDPAVLSLLARHDLDDAQPGDKSQPPKTGAGLDAISKLARAIELGSTWPSDYGLLGQLLARAGRFEDAVAILQHGIALAPYTPSFYPLLSSCYEAMGNRQAALVSIQNGLRLFPADTVMVEQLKKLRAGVLRPSK